MSIAKRKNFNIFVKFNKKRENIVVKPKEVLGKNAFKIKEGETVNRLP
jgi:hypothetical protein